MLLDTNIVSELMRPHPEPAVLAWFARRAGHVFHISAIAEAELRAGLAFLPDGERKTRLTSAFDAMMAEDFAGRVLAFDSAAACAFSVIASERRRAGRPISTADAQIAAIARARNLSLVTRNIRDLDGCGVGVVDPWTAS